MADPLEALLDEQEIVTPTPALEKAAEPTQEEKDKLEAIRKADLELENRKRAIAEANAELKKARQALKQVKNSQPEEEELPAIDMADPSAKAWNRHIQSQVNPLQDEIEREKEEIRGLAIERFLADKPTLASSPEKLKQVLLTYEKIRRTSEKVIEGVEKDLERAYAAENADQILETERQKRIARARAEQQFANAAISRGATAYRDDQPISKQQLPADQQKIVEKWDDTLKGMGFDTSKW